MLRVQEQQGLSEQRVSRCPPCQHSIAVSTKRREPPGSSYKSSGRNAYIWLLKIGKKWIGVLHMFILLQ